MASGKEDTGRTRSPRLVTLGLLSAFALALFGWSLSRHEAASDRQSAESHRTADQGVEAAPGTLPVEPSSQAIRRIVDRAGPAPYLGRQLLVSFHADVTEPARDALLRSENARVLKRFRRSPDLLLLELPEDTDLQQATGRLLSDGAVASVERNWLYRASRRLPDEPEFDLLRHLDSPSDGDINAPEGWQYVTSAEDVVVAIVDSGIDVTHPDLIDNLWRNPGEIPANGVDDDGNGYIDDIHGIDAVRGTGNPVDAESHGTHIAGVIGARGNNGIGVVGVVWQTQLAACRFIEADGFGALSDGVTCLDYFADLREAGVNVAVTNNSYTGPASPLLSAAIERHRNLGILFVAAAGNDGQDIDLEPTYPASYGNSNIITVASLTRADTLSPFSNRGATAVDIAATGETVYSTVPGGNYDFLDGTSFASPIVAGAAAWLWGLDPDLTVAEVRELLFLSATPRDSLVGVTATGGRVRLLGFDVDRDGDGAPDLYEYVNNYDPRDPADGAEDTDSDGLSVAEEFLNQTNPRLADSDGDRLLDGDEVNLRGTDPLVADTDGDGLDDGREALDLGTDPLLTDTDGDTLSDFEEVEQIGTNPLAVDTDGDLLSDDYELAAGLDPLTDDGDADADADGLSNFQEFEQGTDPVVADSDDDGSLDGAEVNILGTDPLDPDTDDDGITDGWEADFGLAPLLRADASADPDGDLFSNFAEFRGGSSPDDQNDTPTLVPWAGASANGRQGADRPIRIIRGAPTLRFEFDADEAIRSSSGVLLTDRLVLTSSGNLSAYDLISGERVWRNPTRESALLGVEGDEFLLYDRTPFSDTDPFPGAEVGRYDLETGRRNAQITYTSSPLLFASGLLFGQDRDQVTALRMSDLTELWRVTVDRLGSIAATERDVVIVDGDGRLRVVDAQTGTLRLDIAPRGCLDFSARPHLVITREEYAVYAIDRECVERISLVDGEVMWRREGLLLAATSAAVGADALFVGQITDEVIAFNADDGSTRWLADAPSSLPVERLVATEDLVIVGTRIDFTLLDAADGSRVADGPQTVDGERLLLNGAGTLLSGGFSDVAVLDVWGDSDGDTLPDAWELQYDFDRQRPSNTDDADGDGLDNAGELAQGTHPRLADTDGDGLNDLTEVSDALSDPRDPDSDDDYLNDRDEFIVFGTDLRLADTDGDGVADGDEVVLGADPGDDRSLPVRLSTYRETFDNGLPDQWRVPYDTDEGWTLRSFAGSGQSLYGEASFDRDDVAIELVIATQAGTLLFDYESVGTELTVLVDGRSAFKDSASPLARVAIPLSAGVHRLRFTLGFGIARGAWARIDNLELAQGEEVGLSPRNFLVIIGQDSGTNLYEFTREGEALAIPGIPVSLAGDFIMLADRRLLSSSRDGLLLYDPVSTETREIATPGVGEPVETGSRVYQRIFEGGIVGVDLATGDQELMFLDERYQQLSRAPDGALYGVTFDRRSIDRLDVDTGTLQRLTLPPETPDIISVLVTLDGTFVAGRLEEVLRLNAQGEVLQSFPRNNGGSFDLTEQGELLELNDDRTAWVLVDVDDMTRRLQIDPRNVLEGRVSVQGVVPIGLGGTDSDGDGIADWWERARGLDPLDAGDATRDADGDGLDALAEYLARTEPDSSDSDGDGVSDDDELSRGLDPSRSDTDFDSLSDGDELALYGTSPAAADTDLDGYDDNLELFTTRTDPTVADGDGDGLDDALEIESALDANLGADADYDWDGDGLTVRDEVGLGTDWRRPDSDHDGLDDAEEISLGTDARTYDTDGDRLSDHWEVTFGQDPLVQATDQELREDTDGDGFDLLEEHYEGTDPADPRSYPRPRPWRSHTQARSDGRRYVPLDIDNTDDIALLWQTSPAGEPPERWRYLGAVGGRAVIGSQDYVIGLDATTGATVWQDDARAQATLTRSRLYTADTLVETFDPISGAMLDQLMPFSLRRDQRAYLLPTGSRLVNNYTVGPVTIMDPRGEEFSDLNLERPATTTPFTGADDGEMLVVNSILLGLNQQGRELWRLDSPELIDSVAVRLSAGEVILQAREQLLSLNPRTGEAYWSVSDADYSPVVDLAVGRDVVYAADNEGHVLAHELRDGQLRWMSAESGTWQWLIAVRNAVFLVAEERTALHDADTGDELWAIDVGGQPALSPDGILYLYDLQGTVSAIELGLAVEGDNGPNAFTRRWAARYPPESVIPGEDADGDGLTTEDEFRAGADPDHADTDGDGFSDAEEFGSLLTAAYKADTDGDGLTDAFELLDLGTDPRLRDTDGDTLSDREEQQYTGSDPLLADSDQDRLTDDRDLWFNTDPNNAASIPLLAMWPVVTFEDNSLPARWRTEGLVDFVGGNSEFHRERGLRLRTPNEFGTDTVLEVSGLFLGGGIDWVGDGIATLDGELQSFRRPILVSPGYHTLRLVLSGSRESSGSIEVDRFANWAGPDQDSDGLPDEWEISVGLRPTSSFFEANSDTDQDGISNLDEYYENTDPLLAAGEAPPDPPGDDDDDAPVDPPPPDEPPPDPAPDPAPDPVPDPPPDPAPDPIGGGGGSDTPAPAPGGGGGAMGMEWIFLLALFLSGRRREV